MTIKYSASAKGFFDTGLHREIPADAVTVTSKRYASLFAGQAQGHEIVPDKKGRPTLRSLAQPNREAALTAQLAAIKREAARRIDQQMPIWKQINALRDSSDPGFFQIDAIRAASNLIEEQVNMLTKVADVLAFDIAGSALWPVFEADMKGHE